MIELNNKEEFNKYIEEDKVLIDFYADWCGPCKIMMELLKEIDNEIKIIKVNTDKYPELARKYKIMTIPNLIIFKKGKIIKEKSALMTKEELKEFIND